MHPKYGFLFYRKLFSSTSFYLIWGTLVLILIVSLLFTQRDTLRNAKGHEYEWVAQSISSGFGYSFDAQSRWLFPEFNSSFDQSHYPTAWVEPIYTLLMAFVFQIFSQQGSLVLALLQIFFLFMTSLAMFFLGIKVFNVWTGFLASLLLLLSPSIRAIVLQSLDNVMLAGLLVCISTLLILWYLENVSLKRGILLGIVLGVASMVHSALFLFVPSSVLFIVISRNITIQEKWKNVSALLITTLLVMSPWILRNYAEFDQFVLLRDGFGFNSYIGNPPLVETYRPDFEACSAPRETGLKVASAWEAVRATKFVEVQRGLYARAYQCVQGTSQDNFASLNEAKRDKEYLKATIQFIISQPVLWIQVTLYKALLFLTISTSAAVFALLAIVSIAFSFNNRKSFLLYIFVFLYIIPYSIALPFYYRYRYPIEPLILILATSTIVQVSTIAWKKFRKILSTSAAQ